MVKPLFSKKTKKPIFYNLFTGGASFLLLLSSFFILPIPAHAGTLAFISSLFKKVTPPVSAKSATLNSQTVPLLAAAVNIDPNPPVGGGDIVVVSGSALESQEGPSGTAADQSLRPASSQISVYVVRPGDTLSQIADMFDVSVQTIVWANDIQQGKISPGQSLIILPVTGVRHAVVKGETLATLAKAFKSDVHEIAQYNDLADDAVLAVGQSIIIPNGEMSVTASANVKTTTTKAKASLTQLAASGKPTAKLHDANGPDEGDYYHWPVAGGVITQGLHGYNGVDIGAPKGTGILAAAEGTVIIAKFGGWNGGYGNYIVIEHANGTQTLYAHATKLLVSAGDYVSQGQTIALVGATGEATGPHLHFEVRGAKNPFGTVGVGGSLAH